MRRLRTTGWALAAAGLIALAVMAAGRIAATAGDGVSPALAADTVLERIALASCADQKRPQPLWASIRDADPQLLLMIGDNVYGDVSGSDMRELKEAYARFATVDGFRRARETTPIMAIWDDHDYGRNDVLPYPLYEITSSSLNRPFPGAQEAGPHRLGDLYGGPNFGMVSVDWNGGAVTLEIRDGNGRPVRTATIELGSISGSAHEAGEQSPHR